VARRTGRIRPGLQAFLDAEPGFEVVAQVRDVTSALGCVTQPPS
jgi:hypothetical protein